MPVILSFSLILGLGFFSFAVYAGKTTEPNSAIGIRTKKTLASQKSWIAGHRAAKPWIFASGISVILVSIMAQVVYLLKDEESLGEYIAISGILVSVIILLIGTKVANKAASMV